jgi:predicted dehydrogenase
MNNKTRFALVGCGRIGRRHAAIISEQYTLQAVVDTDEARAREFGEEYKVPYYTNLHQMLLAETETQVVVIATPNSLHAAQSIEALRAGCHVLCEKPMAFTRADADAMLHTAAETGKHLWVVKQNRFNPPVQAVKALLDQGRLGQILSVQLNCYWNRPPAYYQNSWKGTLHLDGGTLYTQFSHFIDLLIWFFGPLEPLHVQLANLNHQGIIEFEDTGMVIGKFASGALANIHYTVNTYKQNMEGSITIFAEKGTLKIGGQYLNELDFQLLECGAIEGLPPGNPPNQYGSYTGSMSNHPLVYDNIHRVLHNQGQMINSADEAALTVEAIERIYRLGGRVLKRL